jgi:hypothetical protein
VLVLFVMFAAAGAVEAHRRAYADRQRFWDGEAKGFGGL